MRKAESETVKILVLGGSMTTGKGTELRDKAHYSSCTRCAAIGESCLCAYSRYLGDALGRLSDGRVKVINGGLGGVNTRWAVYHISEVLKKETKPDLVLLDYNVNDKVIDLAPETRERTYKAEVEELVRSLLDLPSTPVVLFLQTRDTRTCTKHLKEWQEEIASHYNLPMIDYASANPRKASFPMWGVKCSDEVHPPREIHWAIAWFLAKFWTVQRAAALEEADAAPPVNGTMSQEMPERLYEFKTPLCHVSRTSHSARYFIHHPERSPHVRSSWTLMEDKPGKPGWIAIGAAGSAITFPMNFTVGAASLSLTYLSSYENIGSFEVCVGPEDEAQCFRKCKKFGRLGCPKINCLWATSASVESVRVVMSTSQKQAWSVDAIRTVMLDPTHLLNSSGGSHAAPPQDGEQTLMLAWVHLRPLSKAKVKITWVTSC